MMIDWFIVSAQIINFLILVYLLKKFLFRPIIEAIDNRKKEIEESIHSAEAREKKAQILLDEYEQKKKVLENTEKKIVDEVQKKASELWREKKEKIDADLKELRESGVEKINKDQEKFKDYTIEKLRCLVFELSGRVLAELSDNEIEGLMIEKFLNYIEKESPKINGRMKSASEGIISTAFALTQEQKNQFLETLKPLAPEAKLTFQIEKKNIGGVDLLIGGYQLSWNISDTLFSLDKTITQAIKNGTFLRQP